MIGSTGLIFGCATTGCKSIIVGIASGIFAEIGSFHFLIPEEIDHRTFFLSAIAEKKLKYMFT